MKPLRLVKGYRYFESQEEDERVILITRKHWLPLAMPFIVGVLAIGLVIILLLLITSDGTATILGISQALRVALVLLVATYGVLMIFGAWLMNYLNVIILTNKHIVDINQKSFFGRSISTLSLSQIEDVTITKHGFWATIFDYGDLMIQTAGELPNFALKTIADPEAVQKLVMDTRAKRVK